MKKALLFLFLFHFLIVSSVFAQPPEIENGLIYLTTVQNTDGSWGSDESGAEILPSTVSVIETLQILNETAAYGYADAISWLQLQGLDTTDYLSERIHALSVAGGDADLLISYMDATLRAWGGDDDYEVDNLDTALSLLALKKINYANQNTINYAISYLISTQNTDGGWGLYKDDDSSVYMTAIVSMTLQQFTQTTAIATAVNKAKTYLLAHQYADGGFGTDEASVYETSYAYLALVGITTDATVLGNAITYIKSSQLSDGSWEDDPYSTALAMRAIYVSENLPTPPTPPDKGTVTGRVTDASTAQQLNGASVTLESDPTINTTTDASGSFTLQNIPPGTKRIIVSFTGYTSVTGTVTVTAGSVINLGTVSLSEQTNTGTIKGTVTDASTGLPLSGVAITVGGSYSGSAVTAADGSFTVGSVAPGSVTITASKIGYYTVTGSGTVTAGGIIFFNPQLTAQPEQPTTGTITGTVIDASTSQPLGNVTVVCGQLSATTSAIGTFTLADVPAGSQTITFSLAGYASAVVSGEVVPGTINNLGTIPLSTNPTTGIIKGTITDESNNQPLSGVIITVTGSLNGSMTTGEDGTFIFTDIQPGSISLTAAKTGYNTANGSGTVTAGGILFFNMKLTLIPTTGSLTGKVYNASTNTPIQGATIALSGGPSTSTDTQGLFLITDITPETYQVTVSAVGFTSKTYQVMVVAGVTADMQTISLDPSLQSSTVSGIVTDSQTGSPIAGADVTILNSTLSATTDSNGAYTISSINLLEFSLRATATGYNSMTYAIKTTNYDTMTVDYALASSQSGDIQITSVVTDKPSYSANESLLITADIENLGTSEIQGIVSAEIQDAEGNIIAIVLPEEPTVTLGPSSTLQSTIQWNTGQFPPDEYSITVKVKDPATITYENPFGTVLAEKAAGMTILSTQALSGSISLNPSVTQADMQTPIAFTAAVRNTGNVPVTTTLRLDVVFNGTTIYTQDEAITDFAVNNVKTFDLGSFVPQEGGNYSITLTPTDTAIASNISTSLYVGPHATATFTVTPDKTFPGNAKVKGRITLKGVGRSTGTSQDPLVPLIKDSIQRGVTWSQTNAVSWQNTNKCYGCHVQTQALIGMELSRNKVEVDDTKGSEMVNFIKSCQATNGSEAYYPGGLDNRDPVESTVLYAWALSYYHDDIQTRWALRRALDYLLTKQSTSGYWVSDYYFGIKDWWNDLGENKPSTPLTAYAIPAMIKGYQVTGFQQYVDSIRKAATYLTGADHTKSVITAAHIIMGLEKALPYIEDSALQSSMEAKINTALGYLRTTQNADSGWGRYAGDTSDPLPTAHVLFAMSRANVQATDTVLRNGTIYLLNKQNADGTWATVFIRQSTYPDEFFAATTWAIISLPTALETIAGVAADLTVKIPPDIAIDKSTIPPSSITASELDTVYLWDFSSLDENEKELFIDMTVQGLQLGQERAVAKDALLTFKDVYTDDQIIMPVAVPSVIGTAPVTIETTTGKTEYSSNEDVGISATITNISPFMKNVSADITIEDPQGNALADLGTYAVNNLNPAFEVPFMEGWANRIKITIDHTKIDSDLSDFPIRVHLSSASGINLSDISAIFNALGDNSKKIAATISDGLSQSYIEIEKWDAINKEADLWVKVPSVSSIEDTVLFLYYDSTHDDNITYVGVSGSLTAQKVWDSNYKAVYHMAQDPSTSRIEDSTSNVNNGIPMGSMTASDLVNAKIGKGLDFDGSNDYINIPYASSLAPSRITVEVLLSKPWTETSQELFLSKTHSGGYNVAQNNVGSDLIDFDVYRNKAYCNVSIQRSTLSPGYHYFCGRFDGRYTQFRADLTDGTPCDAGGIYNIGYTYSNSFMLMAEVGAASEPQGYYSNGILDEVRISNIARSDAWIKATYYSFNDTMVTFGNPQSSTDHDPSSVWTQHLTWNTGSTLSGSYLVRAKLHENGELLTEDTTDFEILPDKTLSANVTTDKVSYNANENVTLTSTIQSTSTNYIFENLTATVTISNGQGTVLATETMPVMMLAQGQLMEFNTYWNTSTNPPGEYPVTLEVKDASGGILSSVTRTLTINDEIKPSKLLRGTLTLDKQSILQGDPVNISYSITNVGNIDLQQIDLSVPVVHIVELTPYDTLTDQTALQMGQTYTNMQQLDTHAYSAKDYLVILRATISGVQETLAGTYFRVEGAPSTPSLSLPQQGEDVETLTPLLVVNNASDPNDDRLTYEFELYSDSSLTNLVSRSALLAEGENVTSWLPSTSSGPIELQENKVYYWRARAYDGLLYGEWMTPATFRVNVENDTPTAPTLSAPADNSEVDTFTPTLVVNNASDPDSTNLTYNFEVALDQDFAQIVDSHIGVFEGQGTTSWQVSGNLSENTTYYWRAQADDWLITGPWMTPAKFFINTANDAPSAPVIISPANNEEISTLSADITASNSTDPDSVGLTYIFEIDTTNTFDSSNLVRSDSIPEGQGSTIWHKDGLNDNTYYYMRAKANDGFADSPWSEVVKFFVNSQNDAPTAPVLSNPSDGAGINTFTPTLSVHNSSDIDGDVLTYEFEVYTDAAMTNLLASVSDVEETPDITSWTLPVALIENGLYYWRARSYDGELYSEWMPQASFMVNTANDAPTAPVLHSPVEGSSLDSLNPTLSVNNATDPDSDSLTYEFEVYANGALVATLNNIPQNISGITSVTLSTGLADNTTYSWRARAYDGDRYGAWMDMATFSIHLPVTNITATINFDPDTLNQKSKGNWVTVYIELPSGYNVADISISSILLNGTIPAVSWPYCIGDNDNDGIPDLMVKFSRAAVIALLPNGNNVQVMVTGTVGTTTFEGIDVIRVIH